MPPYVSFASPHRWVVTNAASVAVGLAALGFRRAVDGTYKINFRRPLSYEPMAVLAMRLRDMGAAFSAESDWSPFAVVCDLRDRGLFEGSFQKIAWIGDDCQVVDH